MTQDNLVQYLPSDLDNTFHGALVPGESVLIALPGALGEALAATNRRVVVIREISPTEGIKVFSYPLANITDVTIGSSTSGGKLTVETPDPVDEDHRTIYFATYDKNKFEAAAERIRGLLAVAHASRSYIRDAAPVPSQQAQVSAPSSVIAANACASCGTVVNERDAFCAQCGVKIRDICQICSSTMPIGANYCAHCGSESTPTQVQCPSCGARANAAIMAYCPKCGTSLSGKCASCGGSIVYDWPRCRYCGRELGVDRTAGRGFRMHREREIAETAKASSSPDETEVEETTETPAAGHNAKGAELFDEESYTEAIDEFRRAVMLEPDNASYHCNLAVAYDEVEQDDDARREYERTLELNPNDTTALLYLGYLLNENDEPEQASEMWRRLVDIAPGSPEAEEAQQNLRAQETL